MRTVTLSEIAHIERHAVSPDSLPLSTTYLGLEHIQRGGRIVGRSTIADAKLASTKFHFTSQHLLYGKLRPSLGKISRPDFDGICSTDILPIRPGAEVDRNYLAYFLALPRMVEFASSRASGANLPRLSPAALAQFEVPLPALDEQIRIAAILGKAELLLSKRREVLSAIDSLPEAVFVSRFGKLPPSTTVGAATVRTRTGPFGSQLLHSEFVSDGIAVLGLDNVLGNNFQWGDRRHITHEKYTQLQRYTVVPGDVLISIMGTVGRCVVVPRDIPTSITTKHLCAVTVDPDLIDPNFLRAAFLWHKDSRAHIRRQTKGSIMDGLNMGIIKTMPIPIPALEAQRAFAAELAAIEEERKLAERMLASEEELFASLQHHAFRGEL